MPNTFTINNKVFKDIIKQYKGFLKKKLEEKEQVSFLKRFFIDQLEQLKPEHLQEIIKKCLYASIQKEEGITHGFNAIICPPISKIYGSFQEIGYIETFFSQVYTFKDSFDLESLHKLSPALEATDKKICIWFNENGEAEIWGFSNFALQELCLDIKTIAVGELLLSIPLEIRFSSRIILISLSTIEYIIDGFSFEGLFPSVPLNRKLSLDIWLKTNIRNNENKLRTKLIISIVNKMREYAHGGTLLIVPALHLNKAMSFSFKMPIPTQPTQNFEYLKEKFNSILKETYWLEDEIESEKDIEKKQNHLYSLDREIDFLARITRVDGATIITEDFNLIAFGAKIKATSDESPKEILVKEPFAKSKDVKQSVSSLGGTRHQSAVQFIYDQKKCLAIVVSQDGRISIIDWDENEEIVRVMKHAEYLFFGMKL